MQADAEGPMEQRGGLALLQEMFCTMDAALVRDVLHNVHGDSDKACHQLLLIQVILPVWATSSRLAQSLSCSACSHAEHNV